MSQIACLGDLSTHGGTIVTASANIVANGRQVARAGDLHVCPIQGHGVTPIISPSIVVNGAPVARVGDMTGCGATIATGSFNVVAS